MNPGLAQQYLMQALAMKRKNLKEIRERVERGQCIIDGCTRKPNTRGLCDSHRQQFYQALRKQESQSAKVEFEQEMIRKGMILAVGEMMQFTTRNPFTKAAS